MYSTPKISKLKGMAQIPVTPVPSRERTSLDTPLGHRDNEPKIQICLDFRQKDVSRPRSKSKRQQNVLEVTIMWVKNLPRVNDKRPTPFVKISLKPGGEIQTTELKREKSDAQYIEIFEYPVDAQDLKGYELVVEVCDRKATRNAKCLGQVCLSLNHVEIGNPICQWFKLDPKV